MGAVVPSSGAPAPDPEVGGGLHLGPPPDLLNTPLRDVLRFDVSGMYPSLLRAHELEIPGSPVVLLPLFTRLEQLITTKFLTR